MSRLPAPYASDNPSKSAGRFSKFSLPNFCSCTSRLYNSYFSKPNRNLSDNNHAISHETYSVKGNICVFRDYFQGRRILKRTKDMYCEHGLETCLPNLIPKRLRSKQEMEKKLAELTNVFDNITI